MYQVHCLVQDADSRSKCITAHDDDDGTTDDVALTDLEIESGRLRMRNTALHHQLMAARQGTATTRMADPKQEYESLHQLGKNRSPHTTSCSTLEPPSFVNFYIHIYQGQRSGTHMVVLDDEFMIVQSEGRWRPESLAPNWASCLLGPSLESLARLHACMSQTVSTCNSTWGGQPLLHYIDLPTERAEWTAYPRQIVTTRLCLQWKGELTKANNLNKKGSEDSQAADVWNRTAWS
ncbi:unnamed protein product [Fusarium equiseti]|uniref:Uncharacterized protein n=1 Tax=Fusarium equiseti TaxID=61235 RepID=A0A8J2IL07_FUSEQ|nr:unnamed protein product [Fusarium equiseti]